jgi:hypothetical protein
MSEPPPHDADAPEPDAARPTPRSPRATTPPHRAAIAERLLTAPAAVVLATLLFVLVNYLSARHYRRADWTRHQLFTLSPRSRQIVRGITVPTDMYILLGQGEGQYTDVFELAQRYAAENPRLRVHTIDPDRQRDRFIELARRLDLRARTGGSGAVMSDSAVVLVRGDRHWEVARELLAGLTDDTSDANSEGTASAQRNVTAQVTVERAISEAILRVDRRDATKVCFASGHGELGPDGGGDESLSVLATELRHNNATTQVVEVRGAANVPADCDALVIAGPREPYAPGDAEIVVRYIRAGGNVLMLVDPMFADRRHVASGLEPVARLGGIELTQTVVVEFDAEHRRPDMLPMTFVADDFGEHDATRGLRGAGSPVLVATARALRRADGATVVPESLLRTTTNAWGETSTASASDGELRRDGTDVVGPVHLAMAAQVPDVPRRRGATREAAGRLIVVGFSYLATDRVFTQGANGDMVFGAIGWLTARRELVEIPARPAMRAALTVSSADIRQIRIYTILLVPLAALLVGVAVWRARKAH